MTTLVGQTGPGITSGDGGSQPIRTARDNAVIIGQNHGRYYESTRRGNRYYAGNQAAVTTTVALATTYTGLCISNPAGSVVNLSIDWVSFAVTVAPAAISAIGIITGFAAAGIVTHTTPITTGGGLFIGNAKGVALADGAATLVGTPQWTPPWLQGGFTAGALYAASVVYADVAGAIVIPPGGYIAIGALTVAVGFGSIGWEEIPVAA